MQQEEIEIQLWDYIDGTCNEQDYKRISSLIATDTIWSTTYNDLQTLNKTIAANTTYVKTPDNFANNVIGNIEASAYKKHKKRSRKLLDWGIRSVTTFFVISILSTIIYTLVKTDWQFSNNKTLSTSFSLKNVQLPHFNADIQLNNETLYITSFLVMIMALVLIEKLLHKNKLKAI